MKAYTDLEQSCKLAKILPLESADMKILPFTEREYRIVPINDISVCGREDEIYAWSLAALLNILPCNLKLVLAINDFQGDRKEKYVIGSVEHDKYDCFADNPVDACYEMILKLYELKLL